MSEAIDSKHSPITGGFPVRRGRMMAGIGCFAALAVILTFAGCDASFDGNDSTKVNGSIRVAAGKDATDVRTVNGSIHIDDNATVTSATTVNGGVRLGAHATASTARTVNGSIVLGDGAKISGAADSVNGDLTLGNGADVIGALTNVNGKIELAGAHVGGGIRTVNGSISIMGASHVEGGILVKKASGGLIFNNDDPVIVIGPGATVQGELRFERKVRLLVSDHATIGTVTGATAETFSGDTPPR
jgi:hypothetical protein